MQKVKLTKNELKKQKDALKRFLHYLPTLQLKKQQLQAEILKIQKAIDDMEGEISRFRQSLEKWVEVFAENLDLAGILKVKEVAVSLGNIAGIDIPVFEKVVFEEKDYDFMKYPLWVDFGLKTVKEAVSLEQKRKILQEQLRLVKEELRVTTQRVNLFEKVKIPQTNENIRKIRIYLGDLQTASVVRGKIAKAKIQRKTEAEVMV